MPRPPKRIRPKRVRLLDGGGQMADILAIAKMLEDCAPPEDEAPQEVFEQVIRPVETDSFWKEEEITPIGFYKDVTDLRPEPPYELRYRQHVGTEDVYLGLGMKDPGMACADSVVLIVTLDDVRTDDIDLNVQHGFVDLRTPKQHLTLKLERPTKDDKVTAKWNAEQHELTIEVPLIPVETKITA